MTTEQQPKQKTQAELNIELQQAVNEKISSQRNAAYTRIAHLELVIDSKEREIQRLKAELEGEKLFKEKNKKDK
tara:strand:+ start:562 stop:783 length:222 start_codon:yes stop_codon:yes gene_type:complete